MPKIERLSALDILDSRGRPTVSIAFAPASSIGLRIPLYRFFSQLLAKPQATTLPRLTVNLFSGGKHAGGQVAIQDVLLVPISAKTIDESLAMVFAVYQAAAE